MDRILLQRVLSEQRQEFLNLLDHSWCHRPEEALVDIESNLAQVVIGVRRSGKSTLCLNVIKASGVPFAYVNFDDERLVVTEPGDLNDILECLYKIYGDFNHLFLDEIQNAERWHLFVNRLLRTGMHIIMTGSNAKLLSGELATHLTGRYMEIELYPFSFNEYCTFRGISTSHDTTKERGLLWKAFDEYLHEGGFPELIGNQRKKSYISQLVNSILRNDIENRYKIVYKDAFERMAHHILNTVPTKIVNTELCSLFSLKSDHTAENYIGYLKTAYLISGVRKYSTKSRIRIAEEKAYPIDISFMDNRPDAFRGNNLGWRLECIIYIELLRRCKPKGLDIYYFRDQSSEADFIVCQDTLVKTIIQVSYDISNQKVLKRETRGLLNASQKTGCDNLLLITDHDDEIMEIEGKRIRIIPAYSWLVDDAE